MIGCYMIIYNVVLVVIGEKQTLSLLHLALFRDVTITIEKIKCELDQWKHLCSIIFELQESYVVSELNTFLIK